MRYLVPIIGMILFTASNFGYFYLWGKRLKMNVYFRPVFTVASQILFLFFGGLFHILEGAALFLCLAGLLLLIYYFHTDGIKSLKQYTNVGYFFLLAMTLVLAIAVKGAMFVRYDNFSHWALIVKEMLRTDRYPNLENPLIEFTAYPPGSATYIYYVAKLTGQAESMQMLAQAYMMLTCLLPLFTFVRRKKVIGTIYMVILTNFLLVFEIRIQDLLVDTLLPLSGMAAVLYTYFECYAGRHTPAEEKRKDLLTIIPLTVSVALIKNSGLYFVAAVCIILLALLVKNRKAASSVVCAIAAPFAVLYLWNRHCRYVFASSATSKHAMTYENYRKVFGNKTAGDMRQIAGSLLRFSVTGKELWLTCAFMLIIGLLTVLFQRKWLRRFGKYVLVSVVTYIAYMTGMLCMYLFSMPENEAAVLAGSERYRRTILIALIVLMSVYALRLLDALKENTRHRIVGSVMIVSLVLVWRIALGDFVTVFDRAGSPKKRNWMDQVIAEYGVQPGRSYVICVKKDDDGYFYYLSRYLLGSDNVSVRVISDPSQTEDLNQYDYIFDYHSKSKVLRGWLDVNVPEQAGSEVIAILR